MAGSDRVAGTVREKEDETGGEGDRTMAWILAGASIASILLGYYLLSVGSITAAPLLLVLGYVVLAPMAIMKS